MASCYVNLTLHNMKTQRKCYKNNRKKVREQNGYEKMANKTIPVMNQLVNDTAKKIKDLRTENTTLKKALELMAKDFYDASDDEIHAGSGGLVTDYVQWATQTAHTESEG